MFAIGTQLEFITFFGLLYTTTKQQERKQSIPQRQNNLQTILPIYMYRRENKIIKKHINKSKRLEGQIKHTSHNPEILSISK